MSIASWWIRAVVMGVMQAWSCGGLGCVGRKNKNNSGQHMAFSDRMQMEGMSTKPVPKAGILFLVRVKPIHKPVHLMSPLLWTAYLSSRENDDLELAWLVSVSSQKAQFLLYHQNSDRLYYYCSKHLRLHSEIICHCLGKEKLSSLCQLLLCFSTHYGFSTPYTWCSSCGLKFTGAFPSPCGI